MNTSITSTIRKSLSGLVFVAGAFAASAHAQAGGRQVKVDIPFAFQEGSAHLNPGVYTMGLHNGNVLTLRGSNGTGSAIAIVNVGDTTQPVTVGKAVFHRYGDRYFLREVWISGSSVAIECSATKAEKNLQRELQLAANKKAPDGTEVALLEQR